MNNFEVESILIMHPLEKAGSLSKVLIDKSEDYCIQIDIYLKYKNKDHYDSEVFSCLVANRMGYAKYLDSIADSRIRFGDKIIFLEKFDKTRLNDFLLAHFHQLRSYSRREQFIKLLNRFDHEFDENDELYDFLLQKKYD
jgi:hypothetical protein